MSAITSSNFAKLLDKDSTKYFKYFYAGKIKVQCDDECETGCSIDHGYYSLPETYEPLFNKEANMRPQNKKNKPSKMKKKKY